MPRCCCVPGCKSNYNSTYRDTGHISSFKFPKEEYRRNDWIAAIKRGNKQITEVSVVCVKHFEEFYVIREDRLPFNDTEIVVPRRIPRLRDDAVPTIFPNHPSYIKGQNVQENGDELVEKNTDVEIKNGIQKIQQKKKRSNRNQNEYNENENTKDSKPEESSNIPIGGVRPKIEEREVSPQNDYWFPEAFDSFNKIEDNGYNNTNSHERSKNKDIQFSKKNNQKFNSRNTTKNKNNNEITVKEEFLHEELIIKEEHDVDDLPSIHRLTTEEEQQYKDSIGDCLYVIETDRIDEEKENLKSLENENNNFNCETKDITNDDKETYAVIEYHGGSDDDEAESLTDNKEGLQQHFRIEEKTKTKNARSRNYKKPKLKLFQCEGCAYSTNSQPLMRHHMKTAHPYFEKYKCIICSYKASEKELIEYHMTTTHPDIERHNCNVCSYKATRKELIKKHMAAVHPDIKTYICEFCDFRTTRQYYLTVHINGVHLKLKKYKCDQCDFWTSYFTTFRRHRDKRHN